MCQPEFAAPDAHVVDREYLTGGAPSPRLRTRISRSFDTRRLHRRMIMAGRRKSCREQRTENFGGCRVCTCRNCC